MKVQTKKIVLAVLVTAFISGGGVYLWQKQSNNRSAENVAEILKKSENKDFEFSYLVSSPSLKETNLVLRDYFVDFSLQYPWNDWRQMNFITTDLTASDGGFKLEDATGLQTFDFCAGSYFCDPDKKEGKGFQIQIWNANYAGRKADPNFFKKKGEVLVKETDKVIITYTPYKGGQGWDVSKDVARLFESFEILE